MSNAALGVMHIVYLTGLGLVAWGCWDIRPWLGKIVLGILLAIVAVTSVVSDARKKAEKPKEARLRTPEVH